jgi:TPR repeat protein
MEYGWVKDEVNFPELLDLIADAEEIEDSNDDDDQYHAKKDFEYKLHLSYFVLTEFLRLDEDLVTDLRLPILCPLAMCYNEEIRTLAIKCYNLRDYPGAFKIYRRMPYKHCDGVVMYRLGYMLWQGGLNFPRDNERAKKYLTKALDLLTGHEGRQELFTLGYMYKNAISVEQDSELAINLYKKSAKLGYAAAQNNLGVILERGEIDGEAKLEKAYKYFCRAANTNLETAVTNKARLENRYPERFPKPQAVQADAPEENGEPL